MPFTTPCVVRKGESDCDGRGEVGLYLCPSEVVPGGILVISLTTWRVTQKYSMAARDRLPAWSDIDIGHAAKALYGEMRETDTTEIDSSPIEVPSEDCSKTTPDSVINEPCTSDNLDTEQSPHNSEDTSVSHTKTQLEHSLMDNLDSSDLSPQIPKATEDPAPTVTTMETTQHDHRRGLAPHKQPTVGDPVKTGFAKTHRYYTRGKRVKAYAVMDRSPKPAAPTNKRLACKESAWKAASEREQQKLIDEQVILPCPIDDTGAPILPDNCIVIPLLDLLEYKWKPDPVTGHERW